VVVDKRTSLYNRRVRPQSTVGESASISVKLALPEMCFVTDSFDCRVCRSVMCLVSSEVSVYCVQALLRCVFLAVYAT